MTVLSIPIFWQYQHTRKPKEIVTLEYGHFTSLHPSWSFMRWIFLTNPSHSIFLDSLAYIALLRFGKMYSSDIVICISLICELNLCLERSLLGPNVFAAKPAFSIFRAFASLFTCPATPYASSSATVITLIFCSTLQNVNLISPQATGVSQSIPGKRESL